jgi:hypothetical protein
VSKEDYLLPDSDVGTIWRGRFLPFISTTKLFAEAGPSALSQIRQAVFT